MFTCARVEHITILAKYSIKSDGSSPRHTRHWPWAPGIWGPQTSEICVIMCKLSSHSCDTELEYWKFSLAPTALAK